MTDAETTSMAQHVVQETIGAVGSMFKAKQLLDALKDPQPLLLCLDNIGLFRQHTDEF